METRESAKVEKTAVSPPESEEALRAVLEALLFAAGDPLPIETLASCSGCDERVLTPLLRQMEQSYRADAGRGIYLREVDGAWYLATKPCHKPYLSGLFETQNRSDLSQAAYEVLAVVAYNQPCTRAQIEAVRGVNSDSLVSRLEERGLIAACGTLDAPGRPSLFETTRLFLQVMNLRSVQELPSMEMLMYENLRELEERVEAERAERKERNS